MGRRIEGFRVWPAALLTAGWLALAGPAHAQGEGEVDRLVGALLGDTPMVEDLRVLTDEIGGRVTGTPANEASVEWALERLAVRGEQRKQPRQVCGRPLALEVAFGEADVARAQDAREGGAAAHLEIGARAVACSKGAALAARQGELQPPVLQALQRAQDEGGAHRDSSSALAAGFAKKGTRFTHRRNACQWMRAMTAKVMNGCASRATARRARVSGRGVPEMLV